MHHTVTFTKTKKDPIDLHIAQPGVNLGEDQMEGAFANSGNLQVTFGPFAIVFDIMAACKVP